MELAILDLLSAEHSLGVFLLVSVAMGGGAAWLAGRAIAATWRPWWHVVLYMLILSLAVRFIHFALFDSIRCRRTIIWSISRFVWGSVGFRLMRVSQTVTRYSWINERAGAFGWRRRDASTTAGQAKIRGYLRLLPLESSVMRLASRANGLQAPALSPRGNHHETMAHAWPCLRPGPQLPAPSPDQAGAAGSIIRRAAFARNKNGVEQAVADINAAGGILGQQIVLSTGDDRADPKEGVSVANKFVGDGIKFVVGHFNSGVTIPASDVYKENGLLAISPSATNPTVTDLQG